MAPLNLDLKQVRHWTGLLLALAAFLGAVSCRGQPEPDVSSLKQEVRPSLGLLTSLPIYWGEPAQMGDLLQPGGEPHWVRARLEEDYHLVPLDLLGTGSGAQEEELAKLDRLLVAQPRALTAADNVALDRWVRAGGRLLLVLDPMMTEHSAYAVGDARRFNDVALVPPVLARWGLAMRHSEDGMAREIIFEGVPIPVADYGTLRITGSSSGGARCTLKAADVVAHCRLGAGEMLVIADAAFLNHEVPGSAAEALDAFLAEAFG